MLNITKIRPVAVELFRAERQRGRGTDRHGGANRKTEIEGRTDMAELTVDFRNFA